MDGQCRTCRSRPARALGLLGRRVRDEQDDDTVLIPLIEHLGRIHYAVPRRCADILVNSHFHLQTLHSYGVTGATHRPTIASIRPDAAARQERWDIDLPASSGRSRWAQVCINRLRAMMLRS